MDLLKRSKAPKEFHVVGIILLVLVAMTGLIVLVGWALNIGILKSVLPGLATMKANTALCFVLCAAAIGSMFLSPARRIMRLIGWGAAAMALVIAGISLAEEWGHWQTGLDEWLFADIGNPSAAPGRMSAATAMCFLFTSMSVLVMDLKKPASAVAGQLLALAAGAMSYLALLGYMFNVHSLYDIDVFSSMAVHTAVSFVLLSLGLLCARAGYSLMLSISNNNSGGWMARRFILATLLLPVGLGVARLIGDWWGLYDDRFALMLVLIGLVTGFLVMTWMNAGYMNHADERQHLMYARQHDILQAIPAAIVLLDRDGIIRAVNETWKQFITDNGMADENFCVDRNYLAMCREELLPDSQTQEWVAQAFDKLDKPCVREYSRKVGGKERCYSLTVAPLLHGGQGAVVVHYDCTQRKALEVQLAQSQKLESIGKLAGGVAHDFNNMLTIINGYAELASDTIESDDPLAEPLQEIQATCDRAASLSRQLLTFARKQVISPQAMNLNELVANVQKMVSRIIGEDIQLNVAADEDLWSVNADVGQLEQVLINLVVNARDAMPRGGKLLIQTRNITIDEMYTHQHTTISPGDYVMLVVSDTGTGMPPQVKQRIFEPFFTTKEPGKGTGLGLATCYGIIKQAGGDVWVYSEVGHGTTFKIFLPRHQQNADVTPADIPDSGLVHGNETVLLVEDNDGVRAIAKAALSRLGYTVLEASGKTQALTITRQHSGAIDLLLTDMVMPQCNGRQVAEAVKELRPNIAVVFMSGYTDDAVVHTGVQEHEMVFMQKPFTAELLSRKVREALAQASRKTTDGPDSQAAA